VAANAHTIHLSASPNAGLIVGGTSSGGNIANAVVYLNRDQERPVNVTGQFLCVAPLLPAPVIPAKYRPDHISAEENKDLSIPPPDLVQLFLCKYLFRHSAPSPAFVLSSQAPLGWLAIFSS
jgi:alpha/beta hydrolase fold.